ncbi:cache domain-containing protein [Mariniphaga sediminis]|uniref:cache domain-containing protein n=1 Tax=Mariniphaga sediminis TaxID=1628158 RepID=UPI003564119B
MLFVLLGLFSCNKNNEAPSAGLYTKNDASTQVVQTIASNLGTGSNSVFGNLITDSTTQTSFCRDFTQAARFFANESGYVFVESLNGYSIAHPGMPGQEGTFTMDQTDAYGKPIVVEMINLAHYVGFGFLEYAWQEPVTQIIEKKLTFVKEIPASHWYTGSGFYLQADLPLMSAQEVNNLVVVNAVDAMAKGLGAVLTAQYTDSLKGVEVMRTFLQHIRFFDDLSGYYYVIDFSGYNVVQPPNPAIQGTDEWNIQDSHGNYLVQGLIATAQSGGGFYEYYWTNYQTGEDELKRAYVKQIPGYNYLIGSGTYMGGTH